MFELSREQEKLKAELRAFADAELRPSAAALDKAGGFPRALYSRLGRLGYLDAEFAYSDTGAKYGPLEGTIILEEVSRAIASLGLIITPHYQCVELIAAAGSEKLKKETVQPARRGELLLAFAISEERGGSDALGVDTIAVRDGDRWILSGKKCWITNAGVADGYIVTARSPSTGRSRSISIFYVAKDTPGLKTNVRENMIGLRNSPMGELIMDECVVPSYCLVGPESDAYPLIKPLLSEGRLDMAAVAVGLSQAALEMASARANKIGLYGRKLFSNQGISFPIADIYTRTMMARNSLYTVASQMASNRPYSRDAAALKVYATESCCKSCKTACQIFGASGLSADVEVERLFRDAQMLTISEGSSEICRIVVSNGVMNSLGR